MRQRNRSVDAGRSCWSTSPARRSAPLRSSPPTNHPAGCTSRSRSSFTRSTAGRSSSSGRRRSTTSRSPGRTPAAVTRHQVRTSWPPPRRAFAKSSVSSVGSPTSGRSSTAPSVPTRASSSTSSTTCSSGSVTADPDPDPEEVERFAWADPVEVLASPPERRRSVARTGASPRRVCGRQQIELNAEPPVPTGRGRLSVVVGQQDDLA